MTKRNAFALTEAIIMVSVVLISVSGVVFIGRKSVSKSQLDVCVNTLVQDLHTTRMTSTATHQDLKFKFFLVENYYQFEIEENGFNTPGQFVKREFPNGIGYPIYFGITNPAYTDENGNIAAGSVEFGYSGSQFIPRTLCFKQAGTPSAGGHIIITSIKNNVSSVVIVKPVTGRIRIGHVDFYNMDS
ncbi:MAG: hypothetical protein KAH01_05280 [Caldisericia bacterium]|nr:hypothetical protein [Caldisericia bacterium]